MCTRAILWQGEGGGFAESSKMWLIVVHCLLWDNHRSKDWQGHIETNMIELLKPVVIRTTLLNT